MPAREDIRRILILGSGPIVIGQACEFDYSGTQACRALRKAGYQVVLVNSNPATVMTDPEIADATYIEPLQADYLEAILQREAERGTPIDALLPTMGGQTALNLAMQAHQSGVLERCGVQVIGASPQAIATAEDRSLFAQAMADIGLETPVSVVVEDMEQARKELQKLGLPCIVRPSFTLGGAGGGVAESEEEFERIVQLGLETSPIGQVQLDASLLGWKEYELEVVRDGADNCIVVCSIENLDPMGVHTGDSITVAPAQTLTDREYQAMRTDAIAVLRRIGVDTGGSNVQFAVCPQTGRRVVVEMNPRVSRSSALASKATGFPIAKVAALLAVGYRLDELRNEVTGGAIPSSFEPTLDYIVTKLPRFDFEKFKGVQRRLTTRMQSIGEVMSFGATFQESLQKALRSLEAGLDGLNPPELPGDDPDEVRAMLLERLRHPDDRRLLDLAEAMRMGYSCEQLHRISAVDPWFLEQIQELVEEEEVLRRGGARSLTAERMRELKRMGFSDSRIATLTEQREEQVRALRHKLDVRPSYRRVDSCAAEFATPTAYLYSTYAGECEAQPESGVRKAMVLGSGPNRIGQGIEFDYCCVHAVQALSEAGHQALMVNCNPETVSTDYDVSDRLYFEPVTAEDAIEIASLEGVEGALVQFGGQTPLRIAQAVEAAGVRILGTPPAVIDRAEDREEFRRIVQRLGLRQPPNATASTRRQAIERASELGYPLVVRPSYVLGGRAMEIVYSDEDLNGFIDEAMRVSRGDPVLLDRFLDDALEVDVEAVCDGRQVTVAAILEHVEQAGVHSGDSACSLPPWSLDEQTQQALCRQTEALALEMGVRGLVNVQFAISGGEIFLLEVNPRASRTIPFASKVIGAQLARLAVHCALGTSLQKQGFTERPQPMVRALKEAVFPFHRMEGADPYLGPEMRSTGESMGHGDSLEEAYLKALLAADNRLPQPGAANTASGDGKSAAEQPGAGAFISVSKRDQGEQLADLGRRLHDMGFRLFATQGTAERLQAAGLDATAVKKVAEGTPNCLDLLESGQCHLVVNTAQGHQSMLDSASIRLTAQKLHIFTTTTMRGALRMCSALPHLGRPPKVRSLQDLSGADAPST